MFLDPMYFIFIGPALILMLYAQYKVSSAYGKYSRVANMQGLTGYQAARRLLRGAGLSAVAVEQGKGQLSDHYDPRGKVLRLSPGVYSQPSVAALSITAHEVGHAIQDNVGYAPMRIRAALVPAANVGTYLGWVFVFLGVIIGLTGLAWLGIILFSGAVLFSLVTLPVELDASRRAKQLLVTEGLVTTVEYEGTSKVLSAAALTYVAALLQSLLTLLYYLFIVLGARRRE